MIGLSQRPRIEGHPHKRRLQCIFSVVLKIWEGMTFAEIAHVLGESPNTAASRYRYALQKLSQYLQPLAEEVRHV